MLSQAAPVVMTIGGLARSQLASLLGTAARQFSTETTSLKAVLAEKIPAEQARLKKIKQTYGEQSLGTTTVDMCIGGMRGVCGLLWETSLLDPEEGIRFRGYSIPECQAKLPKAIPGGEPLAEGMLWLLMTGDIPTPEQVKHLADDLHSRAKMPRHVKSVLESFPDETHPMTQFSAGVLALQTESLFSKAYARGIHKSKYWDYIYEDSLNLIAKLPELAAMVYRKTYKAGMYIPYDHSLDWAANLSHMMGYDNPNTLELMRLYQCIHTDHEGGNVSAHATHLVGSALSDPYLSFAAGMNGLAGPLHGLANQEVLRWLMDVQDEIGNDPSKEQIAEFIRGTLKAGKVVPGYGHAVLRKTDPRYLCQREFALKHCPKFPLFKLVSNVYEVAPAILGETGKIKNPWPNVDAHSGVLLQYYGITEENFYTVLFGVSRALGVLSQGVWSRALGLPIERPKSITMDEIEKKFAPKA